MAEYMLRYKQQFSDPVKDKLATYTNWPKENVNFINTVELCTDPIAFNASVNWFNSIAAMSDIDSIFAIDSRGFIWAAPVAHYLSIPMHVVRKKGKLPGKTYSISYDLEYGTDTIEILEPKNKINGSVMIVDDVLATGGTAAATCTLLNKHLNIPYSQMTVAVIINIASLSGYNRVSNLGVRVVNLINA